mgnify:FL=1
MLCLVSIVVVPFQFQDRAIASETSYARVLDASKDTQIIATNCIICGVVPSSSTGGTHCAHDHGGTNSLASIDSAAANLFAGPAVFPCCYRHALKGMAMSATGEPPKA